LEAFGDVFLIDRRVQFEDRKFVYFTYSTYQWKTEVSSSSKDDEFQQVDRPILFTDIAKYDKDNRIGSLVSYHKQIARMVVDYTMYLYSKFAFGSKNFQQFFQSHCRIVLGYSYSYKLYEGIDENPSIMKDDILILSSKNIVEKLQFVLMHHLQYNYNDLEMFKSYKILPNFIETPFDFKHWKDILYVTVFERLVQQSSASPYIVCRDPLQDIRNERGYWYNTLSRPHKDRRYPFLYLQIESEEQGIAYTSYWERYGTIPMFVPDIIPSSKTPYVHVYQDEKWEPEVTMNEEEDQNKMGVFLFVNRFENLYVLLEIKN
jgi:hypothetical protein